MLTDGSPVGLWATGGYNIPYGAVLDGVVMLCGAKLEEYAWFTDSERGVVDVSEVLLFTRLELQLIRSLINNRLNQQTTLL